MWSTLIAAGYDPESNPDDRITCTVINVVLITLFTISLAWILIAFFILDLFQAVMFNALLAMSALILHIGMHMKKMRAIRLLLSGVLVATSFTLNLMFGKQGAEPYAIIMLMTILVIHPNLKESGALITVSACGVLLSASTVYAYFHTPIVPTTDEIKSIGYLSTILTTIAGAVTLMLAYRQQTAEITTRLMSEKDTAVSILSSILPTTIAKRMENGQSMIADSHGGASVLFADLEGFTSLTQKIAPIQLVESLDSLFSEIDIAATKHNVEKIKTIGDCYMAAGGVTDPNVTPERVIEFAKELLVIVNKFKDATGFPVNVRIGISYGQVISGVIGKSKKTFDLWGETVNLASRMESTGLAGRIQVTESLYWKLREHYTFEKKDHTQVKGIGLVTTYFLSEKEHLDLGRVTSPVLSAI